MRRVDRPSGGVLLNVACPLSVIAKPLNGESMTRNRVQTPKEREKKLVRIFKCVRKLFFLK